jgi:glycosyltransferase involved in cell wall biosynthesis
MNGLEVAMLTYSTRARGGVAHALKLAEHMRGLGVDVTLYSLARADDGESRKGFYRDVGVPFEIFRYEWHPDLRTRLERMIAAYTKNLSLGADVYHAQDCVGGTALSRMKARGVILGPVFRTIHHVDDFAEPMLYEFEKRAVSKADHRFVVSEYWRNELKLKYGYDSIVTYNGLDESDFSNLPKRRAKVPTVLFVGGYEPRKGLEYLVLAMKAVIDQVPKAKLVTVAKAGFRGTDDAKWFKALAIRAGVEGSIEFLESVSQRRLMQLYADCDLLSLPSRNEGWGLALMEAMACMKPVVATRVGGVPELVRDGTDGLLVEPGDAKGMSDAIVRLLTDRRLRERMGRAGKRRVKKFSWDDTARTVVQAYRAALR